MLNLTPEQQAIFDRVVGLVTKNENLRSEFKSANEALDKNINGSELEYISDSDEQDAVNFRSAIDKIDSAINKADPILKNNDPWLFSKISIAVCQNLLAIEPGVANE